MKYAWECRRTGLALLGMIILSIPLIMGTMDTSMAIASIIAGVAISNAHEKKGTGQGPGKIQHKPRQRKQ